MNSRPSALDKALAALSMFTRLPAWRLKELPKEAYSEAIDWWPVVGFVVAGAMSITLLGVYLVTGSWAIGFVLALAVRLLLTGGFHEDGLADFFDGFGGGRDRERILSIMKDSHIGSYGVLSLIIYFLLLVLAMQSIPDAHRPLLLIYATVYGRALSMLQVRLLPYARQEDQSKTGIVHSPTTLWPSIVSMLIVFVLLGRFVLSNDELMVYHTRGVVLSLLLPLALTRGLIVYIRKRIGGYTGDCCGAIYLIAELATIICFRTAYQLPIDRLWGS